MVVSPKKYNAVVTRYLDNVLWSSISQMGIKLGLSYNNTTLDFHVQIQWKDEGFKSCQDHTVLGHQI